MNIRIPVYTMLVLLLMTVLSNYSAAQTSPISSKIESVAEEAFLYGFPMLVGYKVQYDYFINPESGQFKAPINTINNEARVFTPQDTSISTPNSDTPYSMAMLDLRAEPIVLCMPEIKAPRYYDVQLVDLYTNNYGYIGSRSTGDKAGCYLISGPDWQGETPKGIRKTFSTETQFALAVYRTQLFNPEDMENVKAIQAKYKVLPLSSFLKQPAPAPAPAIDWPKPSADIFSSEFPKYLSFLLQFCPPTGTASVEAEMRERFAQIGINGDPKVAAIPLSQEIMQKMGAGIKAGLSKIKHTSENIGSNVNGWNIGSAAGSREFYNGNWALRAAAAKLGIYGNSAEEAVYPFTRHDSNGATLDGSKHNYQITFKKGELPPVNAFWSITMYDGASQLLIDNPVDRYLINSPMLESLIKNGDGSITLYIQKDSPGKAKEANWLPAPNGPMFLVMRLYWPKDKGNSVYPLGKGAWQPPAVTPTVNLNALGVKRLGDKSVENIVRTDQRYGHDPIFQGPRGWSYWNHLEYPRAIQNPNLWPDSQSTYFIGRLALPAGSTMTLNYTFPHARYFQFAMYKNKGGSFVSIGESLSGPNIEPDKGSINPFRVGANRLAENRDFTMRIVAKDAPSKTAKREPNTLYVGTDGAELQFVNRIYLPDQGRDGAGWGPAGKPWGGRGLPTYTGTLADGTQLSSEEVVKTFGRAMTGATEQPVSAQQWQSLIKAKGNDPELDFASSPARKIPRWEKYWNLGYSILGSFKTPEEQAKIAYAGPIDGGGDPDTQYLFLQLSQKFGSVYVMRGKMPTFPNTYAGAGGLGLEVMPAAQTQYFSLVSCEAMPSGQIVDGLTDMQIPLDKNGYYTIVYSKKEDRPSNATAENGVAWIEWSPRGEGINGPGNRTDFGMLMLRIMATNPSWKERPDNITKPGMEESVMGAYYPRGEYTSKEAFEVSGLKR
ncbi:DUF1254 domain-containing protein [Ketobacter alkanivorans]|uniref:DUF1254 domain-containing protein n=1 Tax=Ketobacter alkanivorans TaxID=1917421 RepID=A0A2K9LIN7_9GAMM|nr:DUF1254 domain-containing protein [Ketobacter alkanivorans]AUM12123.1 hypothetical protein Kalk_06730 [Ketobacter alkanivorans]